MDRFHSSPLISCVSPGGSTLRGTAAQRPVLAHPKHQHRRQACAPLAREDLHYPRAPLDLAEVDLAEGPLQTERSSSGRTPSDATGTWRTIFLEVAPAWQRAGLARLAWLRGSATSAVGIRPKQATGSKTYSCYLSPATRRASIAGTIEDVNSG